MIYIAEDLFAGKRTIRPFDADSCEEFFLIDGYSDRHIPLENASWESYAYGCSSLDLQAECKFRVTCMHTKAPIPTEQPLQPPTPAPVDTPAPTKPTTAIPSPIPTAPPTSEPTDSPTKNPTSEPTTAMPTQAPVPYDRNVVDLQPCSNTTVSIISGVSSSLLHFPIEIGLN